MRSTILTSKQSAIKPEQLCATPALIKPTPKTAQQKKGNRQEASSILTGETSPKFHPSGMARGQTLTTQLSCNADRILPVQSDPQKRVILFFYVVRLRPISTLFLTVGCIMRSGIF